MDKLRKMLPFLGVNVFAFYILPFLNMHTNGVILLLLIEIPVICFVTALIYGIKRSFDLIYTLIVMLIFVPTIFMFYNESAAIYIWGTFFDWKLHRVFDFQEQKVRL